MRVLIVLLSGALLPVVVLWRWPWVIGTVGNPGLLVEELGRRIMKRMEK